MKNICRSQNNLISRLNKISKWAHEWKNLLNPDPSKQAMEIYFSRKQNQVSLLPLSFMIIQFNRRRTEILWPLIR